MPRNVRARTPVPQGEAQGIECPSAEAAIERVTTVQPVVQNRGCVFYLFKQMQEF
jgi:hypothetical protein